MTAIRLTIRAILFKFASVLTAMVAVFALYYGAVMLFFVPDPGQSFLSVWRMAYGLVPAVLGLLLLAIAGLFWSRASGRDVASSIQRALAGVFAALAGLFVILIAIAKIQHRIP